MNNLFNYVIGVPWTDADDSELAIYHYSTEVQQNSSIESAMLLLDYVKRQSPNKNWGIYKVKFKKVK